MNVYLLMIFELKYPSAGCPKCHNDTHLERFEIFKRIYGKSHRLVKVNFEKTIEHLTWADLIKINKPTTYGWRFDINSCWIKSRQRNNGKSTRIKTNRPSFWRKIIWIPAANTSHGKKIQPTRFKPVSSIIKLSQKSNHKFDEIPNTHKQIHRTRNADSKFQIINHFEINQDQILCSSIRIKNC